MNKEQLDETLKIINKDRKIFDNNSLECEEIRLKSIEKLCINNELEIKKQEIILMQKKLENERIKDLLELKKLDSKIAEEQKIINNNLDYISDNDSYHFEIKHINNSIKVPKVYQYKSDDLKNPIKEYDSPKQVERENEDISSTALKMAARNNTIYKKYRWLFLQRDQKLPEEIPETIELSQSSPDVKYIAMIDINKTKILEVFSSQKQATEARKMKARSFTRAIKQQSISSGHYWNFFDDCSEEMKIEYLSRAKLPEKFVTSSGKKVAQIDPKSNKVIQLFNSQRDVVVKFQMSIQSLKKYCELGTIHNGYKWNYL